MVEDAHVEASDDDQETEVEQIDGVGQEVEQELAFDQIDLGLVIVLDDELLRSGCLVGLILAIGETAILV